MLTIHRRLVEQVESAIVTLLPMPQPVDLDALDQSARPASSLQLVQTKATEMTVRYSCMQRAD